MLKIRRLIIVIFLWKRHFKDGL